MSQLTSENSLQEDFFTLWKKFKSIMDDIGAKDSEFKICIELIIMLEKAINKYHLISSNEEIDDIATEYLKFGLLSHFLSELYTNRSDGDRVKSLRLSNRFGKEFINKCDNWTILKKRERKIFERGFGNDSEIKLNAFENRNEVVETYKLNKEQNNFINKLLKDKSYHKIQNKKNQWKLFNDEENERNYWLAQYDISIRKTLNTLKQNATEMELAIMFKKKQKEKKEEKKNDINDNNNNNNNIKKSNGNIKVTIIDKKGKVNNFKNLNEMKIHLSKKETIDETIQLRTNRKKIFRDPNPWTYTAEEAAQLGLLPEVPKDFLEKQEKKRIENIKNKKFYQRYGYNKNYNYDMDDGSELFPGQTEYTMRGDIKTVTMRNMPKNNNEKDVNDISDDDEYYKKLKEQREWDNWKDDHEKGAGNPFL